VAQKDDKLLWKYLAYLTVGDVVRKGAPFIIAWLFFSAVSLVIVGLVMRGQSRLGISMAIPEWLWITAIYGVFIWFARGHTIRFTMPVIGFKSWLFIVVLFGGIMYVIENSVWWIAIPFFCAFWVGIPALNELSGKGKENFEKLNRNGGNEAE
jgi:hypothetical protein